MATKTDTDKQTFLDALAKTGVVADACGMAKTTRPTVAKWRANDEEFAAAYDNAMEDALDTIESAARTRAVQGVTRKRYDKEGNLLSEEIVYSDSLAMFLLKGGRPEKFADRTKSEITSPDGSLKPTSDTEAAARLAALLDDARRRRTNTPPPEDDDLFN